MLTKLNGPSNNNQITENSSRLPNVLKKHFANVGNLLASKVPKKDNYMSYLSKLKSTDDCLNVRVISCLQLFLISIVNLLCLVPILQNLTNNFNDS